MKILVIGGSYFFGRWFVELARKEHSVTVLNRGNVPVNAEGVLEWKADRHDSLALSKLPKENFDVIVDFCAYVPGDIQIIVDIFGRESTKYIFISTVDVYKKGTKNILSENSPLEDRELPGEVGAYINGKIALEKELIEACNKAKMTPVSVRPVILYGPANYAPREKMYFDWIKQAGQVIAPADATGKFQFIYVKDAALALLKIAELDKENVKHSYNLCTKEISTYESFHKALKEASDREYTEILLPVSEIIEKGIPLPFPLINEESEIYSSENFETLNIKTTSLSEGLKITGK